MKDIFLGVLTSKYDEGLSHMRDWIREHPESESLRMFQGFVEDSESNDDATSLKGFFAILGFMAATKAAFAIGDD